MVQEAIAKPAVFEGGYADFMTKMDYLRRYPAAFRTLYTNEGWDFTFLDLLRSLGMAGMSKSHSGPYVDSYFEEIDERIFSVGSVITPQSAAGGAITIALPASEMKTVEGKLVSRPRKKETVQDKNGKNWNIEDKITNVNPHRLVLKPVAETTVGSYNANDRFFIIGPSHAEATGQPKGLVESWGQYSNVFAIMKETVLTSGTNMTTKPVWYTIPDLQGYIYPRGIEKAERRHDLNKSMMAIHGQISDGNVTEYSPDFDSDVPQKETEGMIQAFLTSGKVQTYDDVAGYDEDDLDRAVAYYRQKKLPGADILVMQGGTIQDKVQRILKEYIREQGSFDSYLAKKYFAKMKYGASEAFTADDWFIDLAIKGVRKGAYNLLFRDLTELNGLYGRDGFTGGFEYEKMQFFMPITTIKDPRSKVTLPAMQLLHRGQEAGGYQRENIIWKTGGPIQHTDEFDVDRTFLLSEFCLAIAGHMWCLTQMAGTSDS